MATSPVPDMAAPPGMCPGVAVLGGGGAGGDGDGDGNGGKDGNGGDGNGNGENGNGDGKGSGACGNGSGNGPCPNCHNTVAAGDPVDVLTGEVFTIPKTDLHLPGFVHLRIDRQYSTGRRDRDAGLGWGWTHTLDWEMRVKGRRIIVTNGTGLEQEFPWIPEPDHESQAGRGWTLLRTRDGFLLRPGNEFHHFFQPDPTDAKILRLRAIIYRNRGVIRLEYERGRLARVIDTAGRTIVFGRSSDGRIGSLSVPDPAGGNIVFARYQYDAAGHLIAATDADGAAWHYRYDDARRLIEMTMPTGLVFHYRYDRQDRCVETWGDYPNGRQDPTLASNLPAVLADNTTPARGLHHTKIEFGDDYSEVVDSVRVQRFFAGPNGKIDKAVNGAGGVTVREHDAQGNEILREDSNGAVTRWTYDGLGNVLSETDPLGHTTSVVRDYEGRIVETTDPGGGKVVLSRDLYGEVEAIAYQNGGVTTTKYAARGRPSEVVDARGGRTTLEWDAQGNCVRRTTASGATYHFEYDHWGRCVRETDQEGRVHRFGWSDMGNLYRVDDPIGRTKLMSYDGLGNVVSITAPDGATTTYERGGLGWIADIVHPNGERVEFRYNREGWLISERNERGELGELIRDRAGRLVEERMWNGRERRFRLDSAGHVVRIQDGDRVTEIERNAAGQIVKHITTDGAELVYEHDERGEVVATSLPGSRVELERDPTGEIVRERQIIGDRTYVVESRLDPAGRRTHLSTSLGLAVGVTRDAAGDVSALWEPNQMIAEFTRDPAGRSLRRSISRDAAIVDTHDGIGRLVRRQVLTSAPADEGPEWVGERPGTLAKSYAYSPVDEITGITSASEGTSTFEYDARRRLLSKSSPAGEERWKTDPISSYYEADPLGPTRAYGEGGHIVSRGDTQYRWDERGFLVEKIKAHSGGRTERWTYAWNAFDLLGSVTLPDGKCVELEYDTYARRTVKRISQPNGTGGRDVLRTTHYVWDRNNLVHEVDVDRGTARSYLFEETDDVVPPIAHKDDGGEWVHYVGDPSGTPDELIDAAGEVVGRMVRSTFGAATPAPGSRVTTPFRMPGQIADDEIGLHYNRFRYYDPETGQFISPDPIGVEGGTNLYMFGPNPVGWFDPLGWQHVLMAAATDAQNNPIPLPNNGVYNSGQRADLTGINNQDPRTHTERQFLRDMAASGRANGATANLNGQYPPCTECHRAMRAFADRNGTTINYSYQGPPPARETNTIRYNPGNPAAGTPGAPPQAIAAPGQTQPGAGATNLVNAYGMNNTPGARNTATEGAPGLQGAPYTYQNSTAAKQEYTDQRNAIQAGGVQQPPPAQQPVVPQG